jgi:rhodanese-related sulfurtransferase
MSVPNGAAELDPLEIGVSSVVEVIGDPNVQIVDCREQDEWDEAHADGMTLIPLSVMGQRLGELDRERPLIVVCRSGARSMRAAQQLSAIGFENVKSMHGGLIAWSEQGHPLITQG